MERSYLPFETDLDVAFPNRQPLWNGRGLSFTTADGEAGTKLLILDERDLHTINGAKSPKESVRDRLIMVVAFADEEEREEYINRVVTWVKRATGEDRPEPEGGAEVTANLPKSPPPPTGNAARTFAEAMELPRSP